VEWGCVVVVVDCAIVDLIGGLAVGRLRTWVVLRVWCEGCGMWWCLGVRGLSYMAFVLCVGVGVVGVVDGLGYVMLCVENAAL